MRFETILFEFPEAYLILNRHGNQRVLHSKLNLPSSISAKKQKDWNLENACSTEKDIRVAYAEDSLSESRKLLNVKARQTQEATIGPMSQSMMS